MAYHLIDLDEIDKNKGQKAVVDYLSSLNSFVLVSSVLIHDLGMHIHFKGFKQLINGFFDDVRVEFFDDNTWKQEWENFMIEAKRFSGRERLNILGDEQARIEDIDFNKSAVDSDIHKSLIGEFVRRHHGRLAHEIALKGFPVHDQETICFAPDLKEEYKDIIGLIVRSHSMHAREAMAYIEEKFPADPHFPYEIEVPLIICNLRIADYFQFDSKRTNAFLVKLKSFTSPFSVKEHKAHLATEYFKTDEKDPETLYVDLKPSNGLMYTKLSNLFADIQTELDISFAMIGEMYGRNRSHLKLRYRRIKTSLKNRKVISRLPYIPGIFKFEADIDLFKLLVGPLYGYDPTYGVRELIQNSVDACNELAHVSDKSYSPEIEISINIVNDEYIFSIQDNGKGMNVGEIKNYFLKAGASFRNSIEWKMNYESEDKSSIIRRTGKFGIGVLASFLIGDSIEVKTKRYNESVGYQFTANLTNEFIEIRKNELCKTGTTISIKLNKNVYKDFCENNDKLTKWYIFSSPLINYSINGKILQRKHSPIVFLKDEKQLMDDCVRLNIPGFEDIIWKYTGLENNFEGKVLSINGIAIPQNKYWSNFLSKSNQKNELDNFPFVSIIDKNNLIDFELNRNATRGDLPFINNLIESCQLDYLFKLIFFNCPIEKNKLIIQNYKNGYSDKKHDIYFEQGQFSQIELFPTLNGFFIDAPFYKPLLNKINTFKVFKSNDFKTLKLIDNSICYSNESKTLTSKQEIIRGNYRPYVAISKKEIFQRNLKNSMITEGVRNNIKKISETNQYVVFKHGNIEKYNIENLIDLFELNNADAVHLINSTINSNAKIDFLLKKHFKAPVLIPHDYEEKKKYVKTLSKELQRHIEDVRGIEL